MARIETDDGIKLYYEEVGEGTPIIFAHEFAGDFRSFEPQLRHFAKRYRCIAYNARGYPPSDIPEAPESYSQDRAREDIRAALDALDVQRAHIVGVSMGSLAALHFGVHYPERTLSLCLGGCGYGAEPSARDQFRAETSAFAERIEREGIHAFVDAYGYGPTRIQFRNKDPRGFEEFVQQFKEHSERGSINTLRGVQSRRPSVYDMKEALAGLEVPTLVLAGDEDDPCLEASLYLKRAIPSAALVFLPQTGHALNLEEPALYNQILGDFLHQVESGRWRLRDPSSITDHILS